MFWDRFYMMCTVVGKSPNSVCKELGFSNATATKWKNGSVPKGETLKKIADYFQVSTDYLLTGDNQSGGMVMSIPHFDSISDKIAEDITEKVMKSIESEIQAKKEPEQPIQDTVRSQIDTLVDGMSEDKQLVLLNLLKAFDES